MKSKRTRNKATAKSEAQAAPKAEPAGTKGEAPPSTRASLRKKPNAEVVTKYVKPKDTKNNRKPVAKAKEPVKNSPKGKKKGKAAGKSNKDEADTQNSAAKEVTNNAEKDIKTENTPKESEESKPKEVSAPKGRGRPAKKDSAAAAAKTKAPPEPPKLEVKPEDAAVKEEEKAAPQSPEKTEKAAVVPTRISARGRKPKTIVDPSDSIGPVNKRAGGGKKGGKKRKSLSKATPGGEVEKKTKVMKKAAKKAAAAGKVESTKVLVTALASVPPPSGSAAVLAVASPATATFSGEKNPSSVQGGVHVIEEQVVSPQIIDTGSLGSNGIPVLHPSDLLLSDSSPQHRFTKMITQPSQELPAEIFQNEQTVTVTSPQKSPKILKLVLGPQGSGGIATVSAATVAGSSGVSTAAGALNSVRGPAVIVRQNSAAGDAGNPDHITCLSHVFNGSSRRSATTTCNSDSNGETNGSGPGDSEDTAVRFYNPSSPGKLVGAGLHNYCKSPLLAPAGTFPPSPTTSKVVAHSKTSAPAEKKSRKRSGSPGGGGDAPAPEKTPRKALATPPAPAPAGTRRSSRGTAGKPPKRDSMVEIPIVNRRRSSSTNQS